MFEMREEQIIQELIKQKKINSAHIINILTISQRQLTYSLSKINEKLEVHNLPRIERNQRGDWKINDNSLSWLASQVSNILKIEYQENNFENIIDFNYRPIFITVFILVYPKVIRIKNLEDYFFLSRNTIISDLKKVNSFLEDMDLILKYTPHDGYIIIGDEKKIKQLIIKIVNVLLNSDTKMAAIDGLIKDVRDQIIHLISLAEKKLYLKYSDESFTTLFYTLSLSAVYFKKNKLTILEKKIKFKNTEEYNFLSRNLYHIGVPYRTDADIDWYCLLFLTSNTISNEIAAEDTQLYYGIQEVITIFEQKTSIRIKKPNYLARRLFTHLRPAIYRIKYGVPVNPINIDILETEKIEYNAIFNVLKDSMGPIEKIASKKIPLEEVKLISYYFGGELLNTKKQIKIIKKRAIVVCSNGLIVAKLMLKSLTNLFPELNFVSSASARDFYKFENDYEIVFSTIPLHSMVLEYVIKPILSEDEQARLRIRVLQDLMIEDVYSETHNIMNIIKKNSLLTNEDAIYREISSYISNLKISNLPNSNFDREEINRPLSYYLKKELITVSHENFSDWRHAIRIACHPLLTNKFITNHYIEELINHLSNPTSYFFLNEKIAIPHSIPEDGVNIEGCALMISQEPILFPGGHEIHFIMPFALKDSQNHLYALNQVVSLSKNITLQQELLNCNEKSEVMNKIINIEI